MLQVNVVAVMADLRREYKPLMLRWYQHSLVLAGTATAAFGLLAAAHLIRAGGPDLPLFAWAEHNLYHKTANKKRVKEVMPALQKHWKWVEGTFKQPNGLYAVPVSATGMDNSPRGKAVYLADFNAAMAMNALYLSALGDILNDKEASFQFKRE